MYLRFRCEIFNSLALKALGGPSGDMRVLAKELSRTPEPPRTKVMQDTARRLALRRIPAGEFRILREALFQIIQERHSINVELSEGERIEMEERMGYGASDPMTWLL